jgi:hypothetical protein
LINSIKIKPKQKAEYKMKNHWDTIAIIGVNLAVAGILMSLCLSHNSQIAATNARIDTTYVMFYELLKEGRK